MNSTNQHIDRFAVCIYTVCTVFLIEKFAVCRMKNVKCSGIKSLILFDSSQMSKYEVIRLHCICQFWQEPLPLKGHSDDLQRKGNKVALSCAGLSDAGSERVLQEQVTLCLATNHKSFLSLKTSLKISRA